MSHIITGKVMSLKRGFTATEISDLKNSKFRFFCTSVGGVLGHFYSMKNHFLHLRIDVGQVRLEFEKFWKFLKIIKPPNPIFRRRCGVQKNQKLESPPWKILATSLEAAAVMMIDITNIIILIFLIMIRILKQISSITFIIAILIVITWWWHVVNVLQVASGMRLIICYLLFVICQHVLMFDSRRHACAKI